MRTTTALLLAIVLLASCNQYQKTPSGLAYKITKGSSKDKLKQGQFVKFNIEYKVPPKDSVLTSSYGHIPGYLMVDTVRPSKHSFLEVITQLAVGDKLEFTMSVDTLKKLNMIEYNNIFHAGDMIKGKVEILSTFASQELATADLQKEMDLEKNKEIKELQDFTKKGGITTQSTKEGALVFVENAGEGVKADSGMHAKILYRGLLLNGTEFDSNKKPNGQPLEVNVGSTTSGAVIKGLDEALHLFGKGGKGKVFIPAMLGYGQNGQPPMIPQYANLIFEIEVLDVSQAPAQPALPGMQNGRPQGN